MVLKDDEESNYALKLWKLIPGMEDTKEWMKFDYDNLASLNTKLKVL